MECEGKNLRSSWAVEYIVLGFFTSVLGSFVSLTTMTYARSCMDGSHNREYALFVASSGLSLGGSAIWTMHFIGLRALVLKTCDGQTVAKLYNASLTVASLVAAILCASLAMHLVMPTTKVGQEQLIVNGKDVDRKFRVRIAGRVVALEKFNVRRYAASTVFLTLAAGAMHFSVMMAQYGPYTMAYDPWLIVASGLIALIAASCGLFIVVKITAINSVDSMTLRIIASVVIGLAVNCLHYVGMEAATYKYTGKKKDALTHGLGGNVRLEPFQCCVMSLTADILQLIMCQHFAAKLYTKLEVKHRLVTATLPDNVQEVVEAVLEEVSKAQNKGSVADYIPELANADPDAFGIALCDTEGHIYTAGDCEVMASIQSVCKPLLYLLALRDRGRHVVDSRVGEEPSGKPFDELAVQNNKACNALVNTGALVCASLLKGDAQERYAEFEKVCKQLVHAPAGLTMDDAVYESEMATNGKNKAIVDSLVAAKIIAPTFVHKAATDPGAAAGKVTLEAYTRICSLKLTATDLAVMGATLANNGVNPLSKETVLSPHHVDRLVTVMMSCGMYNGAGKWIVDVGIPAKSGVAGHLLCVVPGVCAFAVYSPRLDANGNSARGVQVAKCMSKALGLHVLRKKGKPGKPGSLLTQPSWARDSIFNSSGQLLWPKMKHRNALVAPAPAVLESPLAKEVGDDIATPLATTPAGSRKTTSESAAEETREGSVVAAVTPSKQ